MDLATDTAADFAPRGERGLLRRVFDRLVAARQMQAQRTLNAYLLSLDDAALAELGYNRSELKRTGTVAATMI